MKQFFFLFIVIFIGSTVHAQLNKGQWLVGGSGSFDHTSDKYINYYSVRTYKTSSTSVAFSAGYFVISKLAIGVKPLIALKTSKASQTGVISQPNLISTDNSKGTAFGISPFVRYYFLPVKNRLNLLVEGGYWYEHAKSQQDQFTKWEDNNGLPYVQSSSMKFTDDLHFCNISGGITYFFNSKVGMELLAGHDFALSKKENAQLRIIMASIGFQFYLGGK